MILQYLNKRNSLKEISDEKFESIVEQLAEELAEIDYTHSYTDKELYKDWLNLCKYNTTEKQTASTNRAGMKLCEHFFPGFFEITNSKGQSFHNCWTKENLIKILRWNRKSHSTPYLSELRRGVYFCCGLSKNTMYRPHVAKTVCSHFSQKTVLDPCCGWGGRMLGALAAGKKYIGFEPNIETFVGLNKIASFLGMCNQVQIYNDGAENMSKYDFENVDLILTSPPYFNLEIYSESKYQSENMFSTYDEWRDQWLRIVIRKSLDNLNQNGYSAWNVHDVGKMKMISDVEKIHFDFNFNIHDEIALSSSKRQANDNRKKNNDLTRIFNVSGQRIRNATSIL